MLGEEGKQRAQGFERNDISIPGATPRAALSRSLAAASHPPSGILQRDTKPFSKTPNVKEISVYSETTIPGTIRCYAYTIHLIFTRNQ